MHRQVCWKCEATKGNGSPLEMAYTNLADDAPWKATLYTSLPWRSQPELTGLVGFDLRMLQIDLLHAWHLGVGRDLCGGAIQQLAKQRNFWAGRNIDARLANATARLRAFAKSQSLTVALRRLSKASVNWKSDEYPELRAKGYDTYVVLKWLVHEVSAKDCGDDLLAKVPCTYE